MRRILFLGADAFARDVAPRNRDMLVWAVAACLDDYVEADDTVVGRNLCLIAGMNGLR